MDFSLSTGFCYSHVKKKKTKSIAKKKLRQISEVNKFLLDGDSTKWIEIKRVFS